MMITSCTRDIDFNPSTTVIKQLMKATKGK